MTIDEITYMLIDLARGGYVSDDERLTHRLVQTFINQKRAEFIVKNSNSEKHGSENNYQYIDLNLEISDNGTENILVSVETLPSIIFSKHGIEIREVYSDSDKYRFPHTYVEFNQLRYSGNGKFNGNIVYVSYRDGKLYFKSKAELHKLMESCRVRALFENPLDVPSFDEDNDEYPLDLDGIDYIKDAVISGELRIFLSGAEDEISDSSGEILT